MQVEEAVAKALALRRPRTPMLPLGTLPTLFVFVFEFSRSNDRAPDAGPKQPNQQQQHVSVHACSSRGHAPVAPGSGNTKLASHPLSAPGAPMSVSALGSQPSSCASMSRATDSGTHAQLQPSLPPPPLPQQQLPAPRWGDGSSAGIPAPTVVPPRPASVPLSHASPAKPTLGRASADRR